MFYFQIMINLDVKALRSIVKDGIKEMMSFVAGRSRDARKRVWVVAVKAAIKEYQEKLEEEFLPTLVKDFSGSTVVRFKGGKMNKEDIDKLKEFMDMVDKANITRFEKELVKKIEEVKAVGEVGGEQKELNDRLEDLKTVMVDGHKWIFSRLELHVRGVIKDTLYKNTQDRCKIEVMLYNFVDGDVPEIVKKLLENGMNSVPSTKLTKQEVDRRVESALQEYVTRLGKRRICGNAVMQASDVQDWLSKVKIFNMDEDSKMFIEKLEQFYPALKAELDLLYNDVDLDTKEELVKKLEKEGCVLINCDKSMGMSLFSLETMRKADEDLMKQLGAVRMECPFGNTKEEIMKCVMMEIDKFEDELDVQQREYMDAMFKDRHCDMKQVSFPFLKCLHKVQKMTEDEIKTKDLSVLKFRPVVDAKFWLTRGYSSVVMQMMREVINKLLEQSGPVLSELKTQDGWRFAVGIQDFKEEGEFNIMATADIKEAYTNISDVMIKNAIEVVSLSVGYETWKIELMKKLVDLVLGQNYAETSGGVFKFKKVLPMGYKLSGEALDIVALAHEMTELLHLGGSAHIQNPRVNLKES